MNPLQRISEFPPILVRLLAKQRGAAGEALSDQEIAIGSGISLSRVQAISRMESWDSITVGELRSFLKACHFNPLESADRNRLNAYRRKGPKFIYLKRSPHWNDTFLPLIRQYHEYSTRAEKVESQGRPQRADRTLAEKGSR